MTEKARKAVDAIKEAFAVFDAMELPMEERECTLSFDAAMALVGEIERLDALQQKWISVEEGYPVIGSDVYMAIHMPAHRDEDGIDRKAETKVYSGYLQRTNVPEVHIDNRFWTINDYGDEFTIKNEHSKSKYPGGFEEYVTHWMYHVKPEPPEVKL